MWCSKGMEVEKRRYAGADGNGSTVEGAHCRLGSGSRPVISAPLSVSLGNVEHRTWKEHWNL